MGAYLDIKAAVQAAADVAGGVLKASLGTPGALVQVPDPATLLKEEQHLVQTVETGSMWAAGSPIDLILQKIGAKIDLLHPP